MSVSCDDAECHWEVNMADAHSTVDLELGKVQSYIFEILWWKHFDIVVLCVQTKLHILM